MKTSFLLPFAAALLAAGSLNAQVPALPPIYAPCVTNIGTNTPNVRSFSPTMTESAVRNQISHADPGDIIFIPRGASWLLTATLRIPRGVTIIGCEIDGVNATFVKGFNGDLVKIEPFCTLYGLVFDGNKTAYTGNGISIIYLDEEMGEAENSREQLWTRVTVRNNERTGFVAGTQYYSKFVACRFTDNGAYGVDYGLIRSHNTDNLWVSCVVTNNGAGGFAFHAVESSSVWEGCQIGGNGGPAFDHFKVWKKGGNGEPLVETTEGANDLSIRGCEIRNNAGPAWLQRYGNSNGVSFEDCRIEGSGMTAVGIALSAPVGLFQVEEGVLNLEIRGGCKFSGNPQYLYSTSPLATAVSRIEIAGGGPVGMFQQSDVNAPSGRIVIRDATLLSSGSLIHVSSGLGLDPTQLDGISEY